MRKPFLHLAVIALAALLAYSTAFLYDGGFQFDDYPNIVDNPIVHDLSYSLHPDSARGLEHYGPFIQRYAGYLSFALNYEACGPSAMCFRAVNLAIHICAAWVLYFLVAFMWRLPRLEGRAPGAAAFLSALLFALHPGQTQAVTYIVQRLASMAALFFMASCLMYVLWRLRGGRVYYALCLVFGVCAFMTKQNTFVLPFAVALIEGAFFGLSSLRSRAVYIAPLFAASLLVPLMLVVAGEGGAFESITRASSVKDISRIDYLMTESRAVFTYLRLFLLPINQSVDYGYPVYESVFDPPVLVSIGALGAAIWLAARGIARGGAALVAGFGVLWFLLALVVEGGLATLEPFYEHRLYLPAAGLCMASGAAFSGIIRGRSGRGVKILVASLMALMAVATAHRNIVWSDWITLWEDAARKAPLKARPFMNLGAEYLQRGEIDRAVESFLRARSLAPSLADAHYNLAGAYIAKGAPAEAEKSLIEALALSPGHIDARNNLCAVYVSMGRVGDALAQCGLALAANPGFVAAHMNMALALAALGRDDDALVHYRTAVSLEPQNTLALYRLSALYYKNGRYRDAADSLQRLLALTPGDMEARRMRDEARGRIPAAP